MRKKQLFKLSIIASALALSACGSSDKDEEETQKINTIPTVAMADVIADEHTSTTVTATANDSDGTISSYLWSQTSGTPVELSNTNTASVTFTTPEVTADEEIGLSIIVTDNDGATATTTSIVSVNQLTIPLTITGLATDSPIANGLISVQVAGHDITVDVTADDNGEYSVDLLLDDSEADAFISIIAKGVAEQGNAGLISLLGTAGQLNAMAGDDNILTEDEGFAVNVTNITTAQYALAKLANDGEDITSDAELETLLQSLNYNEVMTLATAIKVAIDKATDNPDLALPENISDTLELVENTESSQEYVQTVQGTPEFQEAQDEINQDENLVDTSSDWNLPDAYYFLPAGTLYTGFTFRFESGTDQGDYQGNHFTWETVDGVVNATVTDSKVDTSNQFRDVNGETVSVRIETSNLSYELKRLNSGDNSDVVLITSTTLTHYPNGEFEDETRTSSTTATGIRNSATIAINHTGAGIAYLPFNDNFPDDPNIVSFQADEFILSADGTGHATIHNFDFTWQVNEGVFELIAPGEGLSIDQWKQLTNNSAINNFVHEYSDNGVINDDDDYINEGAFLASQMNWIAETVPGIYVYDNSVYSDPLTSFWFELREGGEADTKWTFDNNGDGAITEDELTTAPGSWTINGDGTLVITRIRDANDGNSYTSRCRYVETEGCVLFHERTWRLAGQKDNAFGLFHKHDFKYTNFDWGFESDQLHYDNRTVYKVDNAPVEVSDKALMKSNETKVKTINPKTIPKKFLKLEPISINL